VFHLSGVQHLAGASVHDFRPLVAIWVRGVADDVDRVCNFDLCSFHNVLYLKKKVVGKSWFLDVLSSPAAGEFSPLWAATLLVVHFLSCSPCVGYSLILTDDAPKSTP
jgi:hypothetical protein